MLYLSYKSAIPNFGDDLNEWLWPQIFTDELKYSDSYFLGIGSILFNDNKDILKIPLHQNKIVFGTGVRPSEHSVFKVNGSWDIRFLRGPLSSFTLGNKFDYITDSAYALRQLDGVKNISNSEKKYNISIMPYYRSVEYFDWRSICNDLGFHYISPLSEDGVEFTMKEIAASKYLITEAMHGAIVADILRVPWHRFKLTTPHNEGKDISEFKWMDWLLSVDLYPIESTFITFYRKTVLNKYVKKLTNNMVSTEFFIKSKVQEEIIKKISLIHDFYLSADSVIEEIDNKINEKIINF